MKKIAITILCCFATVIASTQHCDTGKLDPRIATILKDSIRDLVPKLDKVSVERIKQDRLKAESSYPQSDVTRFKFTADSIPILLFNAVHEKNLPIVIYFHPGGFVTPLLPWMEYDCWKMSGDLKAVVFAVDYRIAPEHPFPAAVDDAYNAFQWISRNGFAWGGDTSKIIVSGLSAGGNLAAVVCQKAMRDGIAGKIKLQVLNCPSLDNIRHQSRYASYEKFHKGYFQTREFINFSQTLYATKKHFNNPEFAPMLTKDLQGLPPAVMISAEFDILRDEDILYAKRLREAGVKVWYKCFPGQIHCLVGLPPDADEFIVIKDLVKTAMREVMVK